MGLPSSFAFSNATKRASNNNVEIDLIYLEAVQKQLCKHGQEIQAQTPKYQMIDKYYKYKCNSFYTFCLIRSVLLQSFSNFNEPQVILMSWIMLYNEPLAEKFLIGL